MSPARGENHIYCYPHTDDETATKIAKSGKKFSPLNFSEKCRIVLLLVQTVATCATFTKNGVSFTGKIRLLSHVFSDLLMDYSASKSSAWSELCE